MPRDTPTRPWASVALLAPVAFAPACRKAPLPLGAAPARRPSNVVFILADDLGWSDTTLYGTTAFYETPNVERLARRGVVFTDAYAASPLCSPTRASILTGLYPGRLGITLPICHLPEERLEAALGGRAPRRRKAVEPQSATRLGTGVPTLAKALKAAGYATGHFGKWHLGPEPFDPLHQGFDVDVPRHPGPCPPGSYLAPWDFPPGRGPVGAPGEHLEDWMAREAANFIRAHRDGPFFLNYWAYSVHGPWHAKAAVAERYARAARPGAGQRNPVYAAMVQTLDEAVGTLLDALDGAGLADDTIVVFFSDNGGWTGAAGATVPPGYEGVPVTSNAPLRGGKATLYEGGTRVPCVIAWPGAAPPGSRTDALLSSVDFYPTLLEMCGLHPVGGPVPDGVSQVPAPRGAGRPRHAAYCFFPHYIRTTEAVPGTWVRRGDWKLIRFHHDGAGQADRHELYDLGRDPGEAHDLAGARPDVVEELGRLIDRHLRETGALAPVKNPAYQPAGRRRAAADG